MRDRTDRKTDESSVHERRRDTPIVPPGNISGQALSFVIAIMSFLACLTIGAVSLTGQSAAVWQSQISREATIQIRPAANFDIETALIEAQTIASSHAGVRDARIIDVEETAALLEPWLGSGLNLDELPVPRLVIITIDETAPPDFATLRAAITEVIPNASLDDHRAWVSRLVSMAKTTTYVGLAVLALVMMALVVTVVFATRGAMAGNGDVIEVLHFVGAEGGFIAGQFQWRFLLIGLIGAACGALAALISFGMIGYWARSNLTSAEGEQMGAFFGSFSIGSAAYGGVFGVVILVAVITAITTRMTVLRTLYDIDEKRADPSR